MKPKLQDLRGELEAAGPRGPGRRYPRELRERITGWADGERRRGRDWHAIADDLGLRRGVLERWCSAPAELVPVVVRHDTSAETVALVAPTGWRIEGLSLLRALEVLGQKAC